MAVHAECPICKTKQSLKNDTCKCGENLKSAKKQKRVKYHLVYRLPGSRELQKELVGFSQTEAEDKESERKKQKNDGDIAEIVNKNITFEQLRKWYISLDIVKDLAYFPVFKILTKKFTNELGKKRVMGILPIELRNAQQKLKKQGLSDSYVDQIIGAAHTIINAAFENDVIGGKPVKVFRAHRKKHKCLKSKNANARKTIVTMDQYNNVYDKAPLHFKWIWAAGYWTGMRKAEVLSLKWPQVFLDDFLSYKTQS